MEDLDIELFCTVTREIAERIKLIATIFPKGEENEKMLKHLAALGIHLSLFIKDVFDGLEIMKDTMAESKIEGFLKECGCSDFILVKK